jgi:phospholipid/cholesterol/gamma-HCH transport system substrate-binding protein
MAAKAQTIRVGLFAAATLVLLAIVLIVFGGLRFWESSERYHIVFESSVMGLEPGAQVYLNGIKVGSVDRLEVAPDDIRKVAVAIKVVDGTPIRRDTRAMLQYAGITGLKVIDLRDGTSSSPPLPPGSQIPAGLGLVDKLETQAQQLVDQSAALLKRANLLTDQLIAITAPAERAATNLAEMSESLEAMVDENRVALRQSIAAIRQAASGTSRLLDGQVTQLFVSADGVVSDLKRLLSSNEGSLRAAMFDLRQASRSFKELARDVRQRPSRLLFSGAPSERKLP